jgi:5-methylcytosine-specific restriction endonuclease McrA
MTILSYEDQLKTDEWKNKRLDIVERDNYTCYLCGYHGLLVNVHHLRYIRGKMAWEYPDNLLITLCRGCHKTVHSDIIIRERMEATKVSSLIPRAVKKLTD